MFDWLRYLPLTLPARISGASYVVPRGPYFSKPRFQSWRIGDGRFVFKAPWSNSVFGSEQYRSTTQSRSSGTNDVLNYSLKHIDESLMPNNHWQCGAYYYRRWYFVGPWFSGCRARLSMSGMIYGQAVKKDFVGTSFFHPRVFETAIADFLSSLYGSNKIGKKARYQGPLNWKVIQISPIIHAASFDIYDGQDSEITRLVLFPVSHDRFICISFRGIYQRKVNYDQNPLIDLMESIIGSFRLEVGPSIQSQWNQIKVYCPDMQLTSEYGELQWPVKPEEVGKPIDSSFSAGPSENLILPIESKSKNPEREFDD